MEHSFELKLQSSVLELSMKALKNNLDFLRDRAGGRVTLSSVIKGNAYGHGIKTFLPMAEKCGVRHFSVFSAEEALTAFRSRIQPDTHIMIMGMISDEALGWAIENEISYYVFESGRLSKTVEIAKKMNRPGRIHLQLETGMNRIGFEPEEYPDVIQYIQKNKKYLNIEGLCTHFAGAESVANYLRIQHQKRQFKQAIKRFKRRIPGIHYVHAASSAALMAYPDTIFDMVRIGIAQYGFWPSRESYMLFQKEHLPGVEDPLTRVIRWKSSLMSIKKVEEGEFVGYGNMYLTNRIETIATVPVGYSHGFGRNLTNSGYVLVRGMRAPVVGLVNMNMLTIDVTDIPNVERGDEVVIIGKQGDNEISVASFGEMSNNLNYEVLTRLPTGIPRLIV